jgi:uncharacterized protein YhbP (UPF0306 family)
VPDNLRQLYFNYLERFRAMALATASATGSVNCSTVYFAYDDAGRLYFAASGETRKAKNATSNPSVAASMDDGGATPLGVQIRGQAELLSDDPDVTEARIRLKRRHPTVGDFLDRPGMLFFRVTPTECFLINFSWGTDWRERVPL